ncbi:MAG: hypothetical protein ACI4MA_04995 [Treponema sp.]
MSQYQSFFISASGNASQCDELNHFLRSHVVVRTVENIINSGTNCGIQILIEYRDIQQSGEKSGRQKIDWRAGLATDEHLAAIVQNPATTIEEIKNLPHSSNILLKKLLR